MPTAADCYDEHARQVMFCVTSGIFSPVSMSSCLAVADFNLSVCLSKTFPNPVNEIVDAVTQIIDGLFLWAQQNPAAATGAVVIIGTVTAVLVFGPGGLAFAFI